MAEVEKPYAGGRWTLARYRAFIRTALQKASMKYPVKQDVLKAARRPITDAAKAERPRCKWEYQCAVCGEWFFGDGVQVDHIEECGDILEDPGGYIGRMFCEEDGMQVLCAACHLVKHPRKKKQVNHA